MTLDSYEKARDIVIKIQSLDDKIAELQDIMQNDTASWLLGVREGASFSERRIDHYGILPEILQAILEKHLKERERLMDELAKL